ncbi:hypothetical protein [Jatrophihabitans sp.]|uniref:hypothetical protein n=1 Tax=Jatrophihabitans sp. TaxID=1932789 RepID=UPI0030C75AD1|nr:Uncharacterized protein [Jatrophihabitans sp.]
MKLRAGMRLWSGVCTTEVVVIRAPKSEVELSCGGVPMTASKLALTPTESDPELALLLGKRYSDAETGLEVLCVQDGHGQVLVDGRPLSLQAAAALPASD